MHHSYSEYSQGGRSQFEITSCGVSRTTDFENMVQLNLNTGTCRKIKLSLDIPSGWTAALGDLLQEF